MSVSLLLRLDSGILGQKEEPPPPPPVAAATAAGESPSPHPLLAETVSLGARWLFWNLRPSFDVCCLLPWPRRAWAQAAQLLGPDSAAFNRDGLVSSAAELHAQACYAGPREDGDSQVQVKAERVL